MHQTGNSQCIKRNRFLTGTDSRRSKAVSVARAGTSTVNSHGECKNTATIKCYNLATPNWFQLIQTNVCKHITIRAVKHFFNFSLLFRQGSIPIYVFLGVLDDTTEHYINYSSRACFTKMQSKHMLKKQSFYVDCERAIIGSIAFKTMVHREAEVVQFAIAAHKRMSEKLKVAYALLECSESWAEV